MQEEKTRRQVLSARPRSLTRSQWRLLRQQERAMIAEQRRYEAAERMRVAREERAAWKSKDFLPAAGLPGKAALRTPQQFKAQAHRAHTGILGITYPFLADPGLGSRGMMIGQNLLGGGVHCFDPFTLYEEGVIDDPNIICSGKVGSGKSTVNKALATRGAAFGYHSYIPADVKGEWTGPARMIGGEAFIIGPGQKDRINMLGSPIKRPETISEEDWEEVTRNRRGMLLEAITERLMPAGRELRPMERSALLFALTQVLRREADEPILGEVVHELFNPEPDEDGRPPVGFTSMREVVEYSQEVGHALARLTFGAMGGVLNGRSTVQFDPSLPMLSVDVSRLEGDRLLDVVMTCTSSWMESALHDGTSRRRFMIYDEGWRVFTQQGLLGRLQHNWKIARNWGISNVLVFHSFGDLETAGDGGQAARSLAHNLVADSSTVISFRQSGKAVRPAQEMLDLTDTAAAMLANLRKGQSLWRIGQRMSLVQVTRTVREAAIFDTDEAMVGHGKA